MFSSRIWREKPQRYRLEAGKCKCGQIYFPPRIICTKCKGREFETVTLPWTGKVLTYTVIHTPPVGFEDSTPYCIAIVEIQEGVRITCQLVDIDFDKIATGMKVRLEFRLIQATGEAGVLCYGYKAVPEAV